MTKIKELTISDDWIEKFDLVVKECSGVLGKQGLGSIADSLRVMNGIKQLKEFFRQPAVMALVKDAQDNDAGFLTDRSPTIIARHNAKVKKSGQGYELRAYTYDEIVTALIPRALEGYRLHGNEINIISFKGMPVIAGKHRRVHELTDTFLETIGTPAVKDGFAFIKCKAKWTLDGKKYEIGYNDDDPCHYKIPFGKWDSIDKVIGLARSKFYKTILIRLGGAYIPDEPENENVVQGTAEEVDDPKPKTPPPASPPSGKETNKAEPPKPELSEFVAHLKKLKGDPAYKVAIQDAIAADMFGMDELNYAIDHNQEESAAAIVKAIESVID
jgi:hypothetical protein